MPFASIWTLSGQLTAQNCTTYLALLALAFELRSFPIVVKCVIAQSSLSIFDRKSLSYKDDPTTIYQKQIGLASHMSMSKPRARIDENK
jgi:hypothetical protein